MNVWENFQEEAIETLAYTLCFTESVTLYSSIENTQESSRYQAKWPIPTYPGFHYQLGVFLFPLDGSLVHCWATFGISPPG